MLLISRVPPQASSFLLKNKASVCEIYSSYNNLKELPVSPTHETENSLTRYSCHWAESAFMISK